MKFNNLIKDSKGMIYDMIKNSLNGVFLGFIIIPLIPAIILFVIGYLRYFKRRNWKKTNAITIADNKFGFGYPKPIVKYEVDGVMYKQQSGIGQRHQLPSGKQVKVFYNPENPKEIIIDTFIQRGSSFFLVGSIFLLFSIASLFLMLIRQTIFSFFM